MSLEATAYHEAGHAIAAWRKKIAIKDVSIVGGEGFDGRVRYKNPRGIFDLGAADQGKVRLKTEALIAVSLAGPLAQRKFAPRTVRGWHGQGDYEKASELALRLQGSGDLATAYLRWMEISTAAMIEANWHNITALATALLGRGVVAGDEVMNILMAARRN